MHNYSCTEFSLLCQKCAGYHACAKCPGVMSLETNLSNWTHPTLPNKIPGLYTNWYFCTPYIVICPIIDTNLHILIAHHASLLGCLWAQAPENHSDACGLLGIGPKHICAGAGELCVYTVLTLVILNEVWCCAGCANLNCLILFMASLREGRGHLKRLPFAEFCPPLEFKSSYPNTPSWVVAPQKIFNSQFLSPFT